MTVRVGGRTFAACLMLLLVAGVSSPSPALTAPVAPVSADQVGYAVARIVDGYRFVLDCWLEGEVGELIFANVGREPFLPHFSAWPKGSRTGKTFQVGDQRITADEERIEESGPRSVHVGLTEIGAVEGEQVRHFAWAVFGGKMTSCSVVVEGSSVPYVFLDGSNAIYVSPESFTGGVFYQDGPTQVAVGRTFTKTFGGGLVLAKMLVGPAQLPTGAFSGSPGGGFATDDDPQPTSAVMECQIWCTFGGFNVHRILAGVNYKVETDGGPVSQLWAINIPPEVLSED